MCHVSLDDVAGGRRSSCAFKMVLYLKMQNICVNGNSHWNFDVQTLDLLIRLHLFGEY